MGFKKFGKETIDDVSAADNISFVRRFVVFYFSAGYNELAA